MKKLLIVLMAVAMVTFLFAGCFITPDPDDPILPNNQPEIISSAITSGKVGIEYIYDVKATDPDEDVLTYTLTEKPLSMTIVASTGVISWTPDNAGIFGVGVKVSDGELSDSQSFNITVVKADDPDPDPELVLMGITVKPEKMDLIGVGDTDKVVSVTACYEVRGYKVDIALAECLFLTSDSKVATVDNKGEVTAVGAGIADILVSYKGKIDTVAVTVIAKEVDHITVNPKEMILYVGEDPPLSDEDEIDSVIAYYNDGSFSSILLGKCTCKSNVTGVADVEVDIENNVITVTATADSDLIEQGVIEKV